jgi:uncharacterized protein YdhG (YjbR/CyaY superfamily)
MKYDAKTVEEYFEQIPDERKLAMNKLWETIRDNIPKGFAEDLNYGLPGFVVPHSVYPDGYHCDPKQPLPFINIASQKNFVALYHMGVYAIPDLLKWFTDNYPKHSKTKLDMGKSCVRFKKIDQIPYKLIGELVSKITVNDWIGYYESTVKNSRKKK